MFSYFDNAPSLPSNNVFYFIFFSRDGTHVSPMAHFFITQLTQGMKDDKKLNKKTRENINDSTFIQDIHL